LDAASPEDAWDYAFFEVDHERFAGRHRFAFSPDDHPVPVGEQVGFLGFPFGLTHLTAHVGYVSSIHRSGPATTLQIDGSVNGGNSGGPLLDLKTRL